MTQKSQEVVKKTGHRYQPGHPKYGGRQVGTQNKRKQLMAEIMEEAAAQVGELKKVKVGVTDDGKPIYDWEDGGGGYLGWLRFMARNHPTEYLAVLAKLQPQKFQFSLDPDAENVTYESTQEALEALRREGLIIEHDPGERKK